MPVTPDPVITAINRYRAASAELDKIAIQEPTLPNGNPADETEEYAVWETARHQAQDVAATACAEVIATQPTTVAGAIALINCYLETSPCQILGDRGWPSLIGLTPTTSFAAVEAMAGSPA